MNAIWYFFKGLSYLGAVVFGGFALWLFGHFAGWWRW
jgi:hypothetical protein